MPSASEEPDPSRPTGLPCAAAFPTRRPGDQSARRRARAWWGSADRPRSFFRARRNRSGGALCVSQYVVAIQLTEPPRPLFLIGPTHSPCPDTSPAGLSAASAPLHSTVSSSSAGCCSRSCLRASSTSATTGYSRRRPRPRGWRGLASSCGSGANLAGGNAGLPRCLIYRAPRGAKRRSRPA